MSTDGVLARDGSEPRVRGPPTRGLRTDHSDDGTEALELGDVEMALHTTRLLLVCTCFALTWGASGQEPRGVAFLFEEAKRLEREGTHAQAQGLWRQFLAAEPDSPRALAARNGCVVVAERHLDKSCRHYPVWSPDARRLLFGYGKLCVLELSTGKRSNVEIASGPLFSHDWSPDGFTVVGRQTLASGRPAAFLFERDTGEALLELDPEPICEAVIGKFSPDGRRLLLSAAARMFGERRVSLGLAVCDMETRKIASIPWRHPTRKARSHACWGPDGDTIVFHAYSGASRGDRALFVTRLSAPGDPVELTKDGANNEHPTVSPDGRMVAYTRAQKGKPTIVCLARLDGSGEPMELAPGLQPAWSPDGRRLAYSTATGIVICELGGVDACPVQLDATRADKTLKVSLRVGAADPALVVTVDCAFYDADSIYVGAGEPAEQPLTLKPDELVSVDIPIPADAATAGQTVRIELVAADNSRLVRLFPLDSLPPGTSTPGSRGSHASPPRKEEDVD